MTATILTTATCPLCGGTSHATIKTVGAVSLLGCAGCSLVFIPPGGAQGDKEQYETDATSPTSYYESTRAADLITFADRVARIEKHAPPGRLLDVGCNIGTFLEVAGERGWSAEGVDPKPAAQTAGSRRGVRITRGWFESSDALLQGGFDVVHIGDVIEHVFDPVGFLRVARRALRPGGLLAVLTPNFSSRLARMFQVKPREHVLYFTEPTIRRAIEAAGFEVVAIDVVTRLRDIANMERGTSLGGLGKVVARTLRLTRTAGLVARLLYATAGDELLAFARARPG